MPVRRRIKQEASVQLNFGIKPDVMTLPRQLTASRRRLILCDVIEVEKECEDAWALTMV